MPGTILTEGERTRYSQIPIIGEADLQQFFYLTQKDINFIEAFHGNGNRIAVALQIGIIRFSGYLPEGWAQQVSNDLLHFIFKELKLPQNQVIGLEKYGKRQPTRSFHLQQILRHLGFRKWLPMDEPLYENWLVGRGMEHDNARWLLEKFCERAVSG
ncbi:MAG: DUF4158 domain-containing protein [Ginsengibacter sp.]